jgi:hypothetical protein
VTDPGALAYDDPRWWVFEEHEEQDGTWTQCWELFDGTGQRHVRGASGVSRRARTAHPPQDVTP